MIRFYAEVRQEPIKKGCWDIQVVDIYDREPLPKKKLFGKADTKSPQKIGSYKYGYSNGSQRIFQPFEQDGQWYATYADSDYTNLKIMTLPDCKYYCSVDKWYAFCPSSVYIPRKMQYQYKIDIEHDCWKDKFVDGVCNTNHWWLNESKTDSRIIFDDIDLQRIREFFEDDEPEYNIDFYNDAQVNSVRKRVEEHYSRMKYYKDVRYNGLICSDKIFVEGCIWGGPYEIRCIDVKDLKSKKGKTLDYFYICVADSEFEHIQKSPLEERVYVDGGGVTFVHSEYKSFEELGKELEAWKERRKNG